MITAGTYPWTEVRPMVEDLELIVIKVIAVLFVAFYGAIFVKYLRSRTRRKRGATADDRRQRSRISRIRLIPGLWHSAMMGTRHAVDGAATPANGEREVRMKLFWISQPTGSPTKGLRLNPGTGENAREFEAEVDAWLQEHPGIRIMDIKQSACGGGFGPALWCITIWYEEGPVAHG